MTLLTRKVDYAILVLSHLNEHEDGACARELAARFNLSRPFVANILKELCTKGYVSSSRGVKGGYTLLRPLESVTLAEFMDSMEPHPVRLAHCTHTESDDGCSHVGICPVRLPIMEIHHRIRAVLDGVTLAELFRMKPHAEAELLTLGV